MRIQGLGRWQVVGAALFMACGGTAAVGPRGARVAQSEAWDAHAWLREKPCYTETEHAEMWVRFDPATQLASDLGPAAIAVKASAVATLEPERGSSRGDVHFEQSDGEVMVHASLSGLQPGEHGFTIHDAGSCAALGTHIVGQLLGGMTVDAAGEGTFAAVTGSLQVIGDASVVGKVVVLHARQARRDDGGTVRPATSGIAVACGVVKISGARLENAQAAAASSGAAAAARGHSAVTIP